MERKSVISSKDIIYKTGISRATLNNYISLGILSRPTIANPGDPDGPRQLGFFPGDAIERIRKVQQLKQMGVSMSEIVSRIAGVATPTLAAATAAPQTSLEAEIVSLPSSGRE
jgi:DNA-binding transcriptional MerR regulator